MRLILVKSRGSHFSSCLPIIFFISILHQLPLSYGDIAVITEGNSTVEVFFDVELGFGAPVPFDGLTGRLVVANPEDACRGPIEPPPIQAKDNSTTKWFALVKRYPCPFQVKVKNVMQSGYDGVIIFNVESVFKRNFTLTLIPQFEVGVGIPAVLVSNEDGMSLKRNYLYDKGYYIVISPDMQFNLSAYLLPFAIVIGVCMLVMISFMVIKCLRDRRRSRRHRLSSKHLKKIPTTKYKKGDHYDTCAICLDEYVEGEKLRVLPCGHVYHMKCIDPWLTKNRRVCPVCKGKVVLPGISDVSDSDSEREHTTPSTSERTPLLAGQSVPRRPRRQRSTRRQRDQVVSGRNRSATSPVIIQNETESAPVEIPSSPQLVAAEIAPESIAPASQLSINFSGETEETLSDTEPESEPPIPPVAIENRLLNLATNIRRQRRQDAIV